MSDERDLRKQRKVSAEVTIDTAGLATELKQDDQIALETSIRDNIGATNETAAGSDTATSGLNGLFKRLLQRITTLLSILPTSLGQKTMANSFPIVIASDQSAISTKRVLGSTSDVTVVTASAISVTLKASNTDRIKLVVWNDSSAILYVKEGTTASTSSYTYKLGKDELAIIDDYTGIVTGIWATANGDAKITETT